MKGKRLTQKDFNMIKALQKAEVKQSDVSRLLKRSRNTVQRVYETDSLASYKKAVKESNEKRQLSKEAGEVFTEVTDQPVALIYKGELEDLHAKLDLIISTLNKKKVIL